MVVVGGHGDAVTGRADDHAVILLAFLHGFCQRMRKVGVVAAFFGIAAVVFYLGSGVLEEEYHLLNGIDVDIDGIYEEVHRIGGLFVPAHVNKGTTSLTSQLGFVPPDLKADGLEINRFTTKEEMLKKFAYLKRFNFITDSDAHFIDNVGDVYNVIYMEHRTFAEFRMALKGEDGRYIDTMAFREAPLKKI